MYFFDERLTDRPLRYAPHTLIQEHAGNDPNAQLVPTNYPGGWNKEKPDGRPVVVAKAHTHAPPVAGPTASALLADPKLGISSTGASWASPLADLSGSTLAAMTAAAAGGAVISVLGGRA